MGTMQSRLGLIEDLLLCEEFSYQPPLAGAV